MTTCTGTPTNTHLPDALKAGAGLAMAVGVGAGLMYFFDPNRGRARRAIVRNKATKLYHDGVERAEHTIKDLENRLNGVAHEAEAFLDTEPVSDEVLVARIRTKLGRLIARPHRVTVAAKDGHVTLTGQVRPDETHNLVLAIRAMHGVKEVENKLVIRANQVSRPLPRVLAELAAIAGVSTLVLSKGH